jgi:hypothetical protein
MVRDTVMGLTPASAATSLTVGAEEALLRVMAIQGYVF